MTSTNCSFACKGLFRMTTDRMTEQQLRQNIVTYINDVENTKKL